MISRVAVLEFSTPDPKKNYTLKISDISEDTTKEQMVAIMDYVLAKQFLVAPAGTVTGKVSCKIDTVETDTMKFGE